MEAARRACWRNALLLLALVATGDADSLRRIDSHTNIAPHRQPEEQVRTTLRARLEPIIAPAETPKKVADGFTFTEGPTWLKGKLYFSDMCSRIRRLVTGPAARRAAG
jgi:hypothetical protein